MSVIVRLPSQLRSLVGGAGEVPVEATTVRDAIVAVDAAYPGIAFRVLDDKGNKGDANKVVMDALVSAGTLVARATLRTLVGPKKS